MFLPSCSVSVKAVYSSFAIWNRAHGHLLISLHPTCFCVQPRLNAERSQYKWRFQSIYLSVQPRLNARDRCKSDCILPVDIFREARRGLSDKYLLRSQRVSHPHYLLSPVYHLQGTLHCSFLKTVNTQAVLIIMLMPEWGQFTACNEGVLLKLYSLPPHSNWLISESILTASF